MKQLVFKFSAFAAILIFPFIALGQNSNIAQPNYVDSLKTKLKTAKDTLRPSILNQLAEKLIDSASSSAPAQKDSLLKIAKSYTNEAESLSRTLHYNRGIGVAIYLSGAIKTEYALKNISISLSDYIDALHYLEVAGDKVYISNCFYNIATDCHFIGRLDQSITYYDSAINLFLQLKDTLTAIECMIWQGHSYFDKGDYKNAYLFGAKALKWSEKTGDTALMVFANLQLANLFLGAGLPETTIDYMHKIFSLYPLTAPHQGKSTLPYNMIWALWVAGEAYLKLNEVDSTVYLSQFIPEDTTDGDSERFYGQLYTALHQEDKALPIFVKGFQLKKEIGHEIGTAGNAIELGQIYLKRKDFKSAINYTDYGLTLAEKIHALLEMKNAVGILTDIYSQTGNYQQAYHYSLQYKKLNDSLASEQDRRKLSLALIQLQLDDQKQQALLLNKENQIKDQQLKTEKLLKKIFISGIVAVLLVAVIIYRNYRQKQKANALLEKQKIEIQNTLQELKATQAQLIQSEKMASLGQLTAGIAHEIQNPLNFVNNFSEVNKEMLEELKAERLKSNAERDDNLQNDLINDVIANEEKINHHGKRADAIVKGMLQHSRSSTGQKELTDINALADEYLRLSYHGFRGKDKAFNATMNTDFDESIGKINIIPQDIGRVLLNLYNNAFYAVNEKAKLSANSYQPIAKVSTRKLNDKIEIKVIDNGGGIPQKILDKIFQPFFTTKPTGQGTGLGLSLSYDVIKAHGGEIKVNTKEGEGSEFIIQLPVT